MARQESREQILQIEKQDVASKNHNELKETENEKRE
jgi:hypothetical protein